tara:strand:+ start:1151 stop:1435 length:285 start_codon:yes stop_codon:yes gene_type:complete
MGQSVVVLVPVVLRVVPATNYLYTHQEYFMDTVLEAPQQETDIGSSKIHISIPHREKQLINKMSKKLMNYYGYSYSQLHRSLIRDEYKRVMVSL